MLLAVAVKHPIDDRPPTRLVYPELVDEDDPMDDLLSLDAESFEAGIRILAEDMAGAYDLDTLAIDAWLQEQKGD